MASHRLARINYTVRTVSFAWCALVVGLVLWERQAGAAAWSLAALQFLAYPHLVYLRAMRSADSRRAELQHLYLDPLLFGAWIAALGFPVWVAYAALFATTLNNAVMRGWTGAGVSVAIFAAGALAWTVPMGHFRFTPTSPLVTALCFLGSLGYTTMVGVVVFGQSRRLREARESLREGERRYRLITEHAGDLVAMVDRDGRWLYASPSYSRILGSENLLQGRDAFAALHEEDQFRVRGALQVVVRSGETCRLRMRLHTAAGDVRRFEALVHAVKDEAGAITGAVIASRDVTELRDREEQLEVAAHAFERMAEGMVIANAAGRILTVNQAYSRITGYPAEELLGRQESDFRSAMQPPSFYDDLYAEVLRSGYWNGTTWCRRRDGTVYREWRSVSAVRDAEGRVTHYVSLIRELNGHAADARPAKTA
ncbi:MAG: PAS domain S-box protein [Pseudomonadota bacterium]